MLVITANWAFTDGTLWQPSRARDANWLAAVHRAALRGGFGRDGTYRPVDSIDIVFAGDTFDCLGSRRWSGAVRPWHDGPASRAARGAVMVAAARRGRHLFATLGRWIRTGLPVPAADRRGRPRSFHGHRAELRVTLLAGDRDRWIDEAATAARRHGHAVGRVWASADLLVHHGAELDPLWTTGDAEGAYPAPTGDRQPLLGESLAVDLVVRFAATISDRHSSRPAIRTLLDAVGTSRVVELPAVLARWLDAATGGRSLTHEARDAIGAAWNRSVAAWHREAIRRPPACGLEACPVDALAAWLEVTSAAARRISPTIAALQPRLAAASRRTAGRAGGHRPAGPLATVLGHVAPSAPDDPGEIRVVCLGGSGTRTLIRGRGPARAWEPLETDAPEAAVIGLGAAAADRSGDTVVDAISDSISDSVGRAA
jgi:hypothetical protein